MTLFQKVVSVTLASVVLFVSIVLMLTLGGVLSPDLGSDIMNNIVDGVFWSKVLFSFAVILTIFSIKELAFGEKVSKNGREGLILENDSGRLIISKESLENLVAGVGKEIEGIESISSRTFINVEKNVVVEASIVVSREASLKEISSQLQDKVKKALKQTVDLDVKYVNIKIKNISNKKSKKVNTSEKNLAEDNKKG